MPPHPTFYVRRQMYDRFGLFALDYKISAAYDQMLRLLRQQETTVRYIPETLTKMRFGVASNQSLQSILLTSSEDYRIIQRNKLDPKRVEKGTRRVGRVDLGGSREI